MAEAAPATAPAAPVLLRQDDAGITTLTLNRPGQFNALNGELLGALQAELERIETDPAVRVVILAGSGKAFCPGHDLKEMRGNHNREFIEGLFRQCSRMMLTLSRIPQPVIARVHGIATAAGCQLVAQCDLAVAAADARFATSGINVGLFCATPGVPLSRNLSRKRAMEMLLTGDFIDAATALQWGLVNRVVPAAGLDAAVAELARKIRSKTPVAVAAGKRTFYRQLDLGIEKAYELASETMACNMMAEDAREGIDAFMQKRPPVWRGR
jgi:enoyl-CoA hydratase/carnithine racemase